MNARHPPLRPFAAGEVWAQTGRQAQAFDAWSIRDIGVPQPVLMENAGRAAAAVLQRIYPHGLVVGLVGGGHNGGDTLVALRSLQAWGRDVAAVFVSDRVLDDPLLHGWPLPVLDQPTDPATWGARLADADIVIDGILGTGVRGAPRTRQAEAIEAVNAAGRPVVAIDVPSGIDASTGGVEGQAVRADVTVAFGAPKVGALLHPARALVGRHVVAEIGFPPLSAGARSAHVVDPSWASARLPRRGSDTHKNRVGSVAILAGQNGMAGAAILAARAAFRSGAGLVRLGSVSDNRIAIQQAIPEAMFFDLSDRDALEGAVGSSDVLVAGPGLGVASAAAAALEGALSVSARPTLLDADALNLLAAGKGGTTLAELGSRRPVLITPHRGEMVRLWSEMDDLFRDPLAFVQAAAERFRCCVLLKGAPSLVGAPGRLPAIDTQSSSDLAVAGMGDVLAGVCGGLMAQGLEPADAAPVGLFLSGRAARIAGRGAALIPSDVLQWLPEARTERTGATTDLALPFVTFDADPAA